jgi:hypothetical protein
VQPFPGLIDEIRALLFEELAKNRKDAAHERQLLTAKVARPEAERERLLIAYYAGALSLATNWHSAYLACAPRERRQMNPAIFERLDIHADETVDHATSGRSPYCSATTCSEQRPSGIC